MTTFQELDAYLIQDFSDDYWADDASLYACELLKQLTTEDWNTLKSSWENRSKQWQVRCAEILDWGDKPQAVPLLLEMIREGDDELTLTAADSLRSIGVAELDFPIDEDVLERLQAVAQTGNIAKRIISELLGQLEVKAYRDFLIEVLQATEESGADSQVVYPLLEANLDKLDDKFAQALRSWATATLAKLEPEQAQGIVEDIGNFSNRIQKFPLGNRASNLEIAITGYEVVATVFTREAYPQDWATTQNNLGSAYLDRIRGERAENLEAAIRCYEAALQVHTRQAFPHEWATTQINLGNAYSNRIRGERAENLEAAIRCYEASLQVRTRQAFPQQWAITQINLGNAYLYRIQGNRAENLEAAIHCYEAALQIRTRQTVPQDWAMTENNLGVAYSNRILGERAENLQAAIRCYLAALEVRTRQAFPQDHITTQFNLGLAYQYARQFPNAYTAFAAAIDSVELLGGEIICDDEVKQKLAAEWNVLYQRMVEVCLEMHDYAKAIEYVERSQAGNLVELLPNRDLYPEGDIPADILNQLNRLRQEITPQPQLIDIEVERRRRGILAWKTA
jgi:tetratricopeptide (TPR) repeat protein